MSTVIARSAESAIHLASWVGRLIRDRLGMGDAWPMSPKKPLPKWVYFIPFMIAGLIVFAMAYGLARLGE